MSVTGHLAGLGLIRQQAPRPKRRRWWNTPVDDFTDDKAIAVLTRQWRRSYLIKRGYAARWLALRPDEHGIIRIIGADSPHELHKALIADSRQNIR